MIATPLIITGGILFFCGFWSFPFVAALEWDRGYRWGAVGILAGLSCVIVAFFVGSINEGWFA